MPLHFRNRLLYTVDVGFCNLDLLGRVAVHRLAPTDQFFSSMVGRCCSLPHQNLHVSGDGGSLRSCQREMSCPAKQAILHISVAQYQDVSSVLLIARHQSQEKEYEDMQSLEDQLAMSS